MSRIALLIAGALALTACGESTFEPLTAPPARGVYRLVSLAGRPLPTTAACGVFEIVEGRLSLGADGRAEHFLRYAEPGTRDEVTYSGAGRYRAAGAGVEVELTGSWSHAPEEFESRMQLTVTPEGLTRPTGTECDAAFPELYRRIGP